MQQVFMGRTGYAVGSLVLLAALACSRGGNGDADTTRVSSDAPCGSDSRRVAEQLVEQMRLVSLLAPDSVVSRELTEAYGALATPELLATWKAGSSPAPGREVSNPWPARLEIASAKPDGGECSVAGVVAYVTTADTMTAVERRPVTIRVRNDNGWKVSAFGMAASRSTTSATGSTADTGRGVTAVSLTPVQLVRRYYDAIQQRDFDRAYSLWSDSGRASGKSREEFEEGFAHTTRVRATIPDSASLEGAAGSQYATVPVTVESRLRNGTQQHFAGTYILRRSMVDGATEEQRRWHIYSASIRPR